MSIVHFFPGHNSQTLLVLASHSVKELQGTRKKSPLTSSFLDVPRDSR